ncbi:hypothetical protein F0562_018827 [Nyssa sinensis]|uniref:RING-type domain-containing protein n=1 Tax=Nyssa sinensis TaxID=561372 RepID=A0A5J4ZCU3_9ASTE|nr:hypothetical protein F0562_018827 [Nyssa sinensis]
MDGVDRMERRKSLKERLGLQGIACCGATWGFGPPSMSVREDEEDEESPPQQQEAAEQIEVIDVGQTPPVNILGPGCVGQIPASSGMNLATALAAERQLREGQQDSDRVGASPVRPTENGPNDNTTAGTAAGTPFRVSLMRLLEETDGVDEETEIEGKGVGFDSMCCVCMGRKKGAAFIPCGHTFCRVCSRELWLNRGSCPLCNRLILEILDIF